MRVGLEVHQQLSSKQKLFCPCPPFTEAEASAESADRVESRFPIQFTRVLRATASELGETDLAARFESRREIRVRYFCNSRTSCLVEADEEPPHPINGEAIDTALIFALALKSRIIDEIHVMRKIVVDGSNTSGFQRTAVVSLGGYLEYGGAGSRVGVQSISLEEDAARAVKLEGISGERTYILDRLGTPLVEVALAPIEDDPDAVREAAGALGRLVRSSGRTARGLGTIRQDLNVSVMNGAVVEVKGVQKLEQIPKVVEFEAARQKFFHDLATEIRGRVGPVPTITVHDVTELFRNSSARAMRESFASSSGSEAKVSCILVKDYAGFFSKENVFHSRLGKELAAIARTYGLGGVFHSDELPDYGVSEEEVESLRAKLSARETDGFVLLAGDRVEVVDATVSALVERLKISPKGIPAETRAATQKGETVFLRPRPGAARMYPETDVPLIRTTVDHLDKLRTMIPEPWDKQVADFASKFALSPQLASQLFDSDRKDAFVKTLSTTGLSPGFVAYSLVDTVQSLSREGIDTDRISNEQFREALGALDNGKFAKEALPKLLAFLASHPGSPVEGALGELNLGTIKQQELLEIVKETISKNSELLKAKGGASQGAIMGKVMEKVRGRIDGKVVSETVQRELERTLSLK